MTYSFNILTALSVQVGGVVFAAVIDERQGSVRIQQTGEPLNGEAEALPEAWAVLAGRIKRTRPDLKLEEST